MHVIILFSIIVFVYAESHFATSVNSKVYAWKIIISGSVSSTLNVLTWGDDVNLASEPSSLVELLRWLYAVQFNIWQKLCKQVLNALTSIPSSPWAPSKNNLERQCFMSRHLYATSNLTLVAPRNGSLMRLVVESSRENPLSFSRGKLIPFLFWGSKTLSCSNHPLFFRF